MDKRETEELCRRLSGLERRGVFRGGRIVLFGVCLETRDIMKALRGLGLAPDAIVDNDSRKAGSDCLGLKVANAADRLAPFDRDARVLVYAPRFYREIVHQLRLLGYEYGKQVFCLHFRTDESLFSLLRTLVDILRGWRAYGRIVRKYSRRRVVFIAPYAGVGDVYLAGLFLPGLLRRLNIDEYALVVLNQACRQVAEMFGLSNIEVLPRHEADGIINCERAFRTGWPIHVLNDSWLVEHTNPIHYLRGYKGLDFASMFRYFVFGLDDRAAWELPANTGGGKAADLFFRQGLPPGRTVVISPRSNTLFEPPASFWNAIIEHCQAAGYAVCTNCGSPDEPPLEGTRAAHFPLDAAVGFLNLAGCFIGVRSGLCDVVSSSSCKKAILYKKNGSFGNGTAYNYFSLKKMGLCPDALELEYADGDYGDVLAKIMELVA